MEKKETDSKPSREERNKKSFPIVGIGASAGGLEAIEGFFSHTPSDSNMAFVIIQHLDPKHKSIMASLLSKHTQMKVMEADDGMKIEANYVYLNPPNKNMAIMNRVLHLMEVIKTRQINLPIDFFFRSLSEDQGEKAICIVLSGTGTDGTLGLKAIKGSGGMTMAQEERQAQYTGMPRSAIDTGLVDYILPVEKMPEEIIKYVQHPYIEGSEKIGTPEQQFQNTLQKIFLLIRSSTGHDFSNYKPNTIHRRIERRMAVHQISGIADYFRYLQQSPAEVDALFKDLLIGVTNFFRDPKAFKILDEKVLPRLLEKKQSDMPVRIWIPGCATGEEAYSMAMLLVETMERLKKNLAFQIFATDIDSDAIENARKAVYPESIAADVSAERLKRFFIKEENAYRINKQIRENVVFAVQNLIKDPPFSKLDLISCRNLMIYMDQVLQKKIVSLFHYTLNQDGILFLGSSESIGEFVDIFSPIDTKWKIFIRKGVSPEKVTEYPSRLCANTSALFQRSEKEKIPDEADIRSLAEQIILRDYAPPCVLVNEKHEILHFYGPTDRYLAQPIGKPIFNIVKMARESLRYNLSTALHKALKQKKTVVYEGLKIKDNDAFKTFDLVVNPIAEPPSLQGLMMVIFNEKSPCSKLVPKKTKAPETEEVPRIVTLEQELQSTREYLQTTIEELETANEELNSTNEEMQSTNEELQSTNEELETSKEELQSTNEELITVNTELQSKVEELSKAKNDINNLFASTEIGTIFLDTNLCIRFFTPSISRVFNLIEADIGRPISDLTSKIVHENLYKEAKEVLDTLNQKEVEIQSTEGKWFSMRILPYRTLENIIDGVVITFVDISELKKMQDAQQNARLYAESILKTVREPLIVLDSDFRVKSANESFYSTFQVSPDETENRLIYELGNRQWDIPRLREFLDKIILENSHFNDYEVDNEFPIIGHKTMVLNARLIHQEAEEPHLILLAIEDISKIKEAYTKLKQSTQLLIQAEKTTALGTMVAGVAHELNNPLMGMLNFIQYCMKKTSPEDKRFTCLQDTERETKRCIAIVDNLLTFCHIDKEGEGGFQKGNCAAVFERILKLLSYRIEKERVHVIHHYAEDIPEIWMRVDSIQQVFLNMMTNALDALKESEKKEIHIDINRKGEFLQVAIADSGAGIASENIQKIFDPFFTTKAPGLGTGLGLSICRSIVEMHEGRIICTSEPEKGTTFEILLPIEMEKRRIEQNG